MRVRRQSLKAGSGTGPYYRYQHCAYFANFPVLTSSLTPVDAMRPITRNGIGHLQGGGAAVRAVTKPLVENGGCGSNFRRWLDLRGPYLAV
jgi:hypothetical protein